MKLKERALPGLHSHILGKINAIQVERDSRIVDVGCGTGAMLENLAALGYSNLHGLDIARPPDARPGITFLGLRDFVWVDQGPGSRREADFHRV